MQAPSKRTAAIDDSVMVDARVVRFGHYLFIAHSEARLQRESFLSRVLEYIDGEWKVLAEWPWQSVALALSSLQPLQVEVLGRDGEVGTVTQAGASSARIDPTRPVGPFRGIESVAAGLFAFGMKREVFRREQTGAWSRITEGMEAAVPAAGLTMREKVKLRLADVGGINALAVDQSQRLFVFGMKGEIWRRESDKWVRVDSPTNVMLKDAIQGSDHSIFVCGQSGTILNGSGDVWRVVSYVGPPGLDFCSICQHNRRIFVADGHSLRLLENGELKLVNFGTKGIVPCAVVVAGPGAILSVAGQEVWASADALSWNRILG